MPSSHSDNNGLPQNSDDRSEQERDAERIYLDGVRARLAKLQSEVDRLKRILEAHDEEIDETGEVRIGGGVILPMLRRRGTWTSEEDIIEECARKRGTLAGDVRRALTQLVNSDTISKRIGHDKRKLYGLPELDV